jgi:AsmA-like C-terminal region
MPLPSELTRIWNTRGVTAASILLALLAIAGVVLAARWPFTPSKVLKSIRDSWPGTVKADRVRPTYFPHPGCTIENLVLGLPSSRSQEPTLVTMRKARIQASYVDLFLRPGHLTRLVLEGLRIEVPVFSAGPAPENTTSASENLTTSFGEVETQDAALIVKRSRGAEPLKFFIHRLVLRSVSGNAPMFYEGLVSNPEPPGEVHVRGQFGPWESKELKEVPLSGSYTFENAQLAKFRGIAGVLSSTGDFDGPLGQITVQGAVNVPAFQVTRSHHDVSLTAKFDATVDATHGDVNLKTVDASFLRTAVHAEGRIASTEGRRGKTTSLNLTVPHGQIQDVLDLFVTSKMPPMDGITNFQTHIEIPPGDQPFLKKIVMEGTFAIRDAVLTNQNRQSQVDLLSKRASGEKKQKETDRVNARLEGRVAVRNGSALFAPVSFQIPGASITMTGQFNLLNQHLDFHGDARTQAELSEVTTGVKAILLKPIDSLFKKKNAGADVRVGMTGTYRNPHFGVELPIKK